MAGQDLPEGLSARSASGDGARPSVLRAAGAMGLATFLSRILGLVREQIFAVLFGAGNATDAFYVAFRIPNMLRNLFAEGAMSASLVPIFTRTRAEEGERRAWRVAGLVFRVLFVSVGILALLGVLLAPQLASLYASAYKLVPGKFELTVRMTRVIFPFFPFIALAAAFMGVLNACGVFFIPSFASALFNLASILVGVGCAEYLFRHGSRIGLLPIEGMAVGVLAGGLVQALCQLPALRRVGYRWLPREGTDPSWKQDPALRKMLWMMVPGTVGLAATQVSLFVNTILATSLGTGPVSWLNYSFRLMQFPIGIFGVSLAQATLPRISEQWVRRDLVGVEETLNRTLKQTLAINLPAAAGLAFLGFPIVQLIFQYGRFTGESTQATAMALRMYALGLPAYSAVKILVPACYALGNTRIPVISSVLAVAITVVLNLIMVHPFGYWGLALGMSVSATINAVFLLFSVQKLMQAAGGRFPVPPLVRVLAKNVAVSLVMGAACYWTWRYLDRSFPDHVFLERLGRGALPFARGAKVSMVLLEGGLLVVWLSKLLRLEDTSEAFDFFVEKLKKKLRTRQT